MECWNKGAPTSQVFWWGLYWVVLGMLRQLKKIVAWCVTPTSYQCEESL
jgi:hypothetical protein